MDNEIDALERAFIKQGAEEAKLITETFRLLRRNAELRREFFKQMASVATAAGNTPAPANTYDAGSLADQIEQARRRIPGARVQ